MAVRGVIAMLVAVMNAGNNSGISRTPDLGLKFTNELPEERLPSRPQNMKAKKRVRSRPELRRRLGAR